MWMPDCIQIRLVVESNGVHHQSVSVPGADMIAEPGWIRIFGMHTAINVNDLEYVPRFIENGKDLVGFNQAHGERRVDRSRQALGQTVSRVIELRGVVVFKYLCVLGGKRNGS